MFLNILELIFLAFELLFLILFFVTLKKNSEETIEKVKGKLMFLLNAMLIFGILLIATYVVEFIIYIINLI